MKCAGWVFVITLSIDNVALSQTQDTTSFDYYFQAADSLSSDDIESALYFGRKAVNKAFEEKNIEKVGKANWMCGWLMYIKGDLVNSFKYYISTKKAFDKLGNDKYLVQIEENLGGIAMDNGAFDIARKIFKQRLATAKRIGDKQVAGAYFDLGLAYFNSNIVDSSARYHLKALRIYEKNYDKSDSMMVARIYIELGRIDYQLAKNIGEAYLDSAINKYEKAMEVDSSPTLKGMAFNNIGEALLAYGKLDTAKAYFDTALNLKELAGSERNKVSTLNNLGVIYFKKGSHQKAIKLFQEAIDMNIGFDSVAANIDDSNLMLEMNKNTDLLKSYQYLDSIYRKNPELSYQANPSKIISRYNDIVGSNKAFELEEAGEVIRVSYSEYRYDIAQEKRKTRFAQIGLAIVGFLLLVFAIYRFTMNRRSAAIKRREREDIENDLKRVKSL